MLKCYPVVKKNPQPKSEGTLKDQGYMYF